MLAAHDGPVLGLHPMFGLDSGSLASKLWSGVMDASRKHTNGFWSKFRSGALGCIVLALSSTIRIWRLFRLCHFATFAYGLHCRRKCSA